MKAKTQRFISKPAAVLMQLLKASLTDSPKLPHHRLLINIMT